MTSRDVATEIHAAIRADEFRIDGLNVASTEFRLPIIDAMSRLLREAPIADLDNLSQDIARDLEAEWRRLEAGGGSIDLG